MTDPNKPPTNFGNSGTPFTINFQGAQSQPTQPPAFSLGGGLKPGENPFSINLQSQSSNSNQANQQPNIFTFQSQGNPFGSQSQTQSPFQINTQENKPAFGQPQNQPVTQSSGFGYKPFNPGVFALNTKSPEENKGLPGMGSSMKEQEKMDNAQTPALTSNFSFFPQQSSTTPPQSSFNPGANLGKTNIIKPVSIGLATLTSTNNQTEELQTEEKKNVPPPQTDKPVETQQPIFGTFVPTKPASSPFQQPIKPAENKNTDSANQESKAGNQKPIGFQFLLTGATDFNPNFGQPTTPNAETQKPKPGGFASQLPTPLQKSQDQTTQEKEGKQEEVKEPQIVESSKVNNQEQQLQEPSSLKDKDKSSITNESTLKKDPISAFNPIGSNINSISQIPPTQQPQKIEEEKKEEPEKKEEIAKFFNPTQGSNPASTPANMFSINTAKPAPVSTQFNMSLGVSNQASTLPKQDGKPPVQTTIKFGGPTNQAPIKFGGSTQENPKPTGFNPISSFNPTQTGFNLGQGPIKKEQEEEKKAPTVSFPQSQPVVQQTDSSLLKQESHSPIMNISNQNTSNISLMVSNQASIGKNEESKGPSPAPFKPQEEAKISPQRIPSPSKLNQSAKKEEGPYPGASKQDEKHKIDHNLFMQHTVEQGFTIMQKQFGDTYRSFEELFEETREQELQLYDDLKTYETIDFYTLQTEEEIKNMKEKLEDIEVTQNYIYDILNQLDIELDSDLNGGTLGMVYRKDDEFQKYIKGRGGNVGQMVEYTDTISEGMLECNKLMKQFQGKLQEAQDVKEKEREHIMQSKIDKHNEKQIAMFTVERTLEQQMSLLKNVEEQSQSLTTTTRELMKKFITKS